MLNFWLTLWRLTRIPQNNVFIYVYTFRTNKEHISHPISNEHKNVSAIKLNSFNKTIEAIHTQRQLTKKTFVMAISLPQIVRCRNIKMLQISASFPGHVIFLHYISVQIQFSHMIIDHFSHFSEYDSTRGSSSDFVVDIHHRFLQ